ncbi:inovirus Gp2 family protein [Psychromonas sp.]|uniref:inovirus Gp2 family protein n=1 Tax=Psychromonas sp. TaxID=1884585 RepID=UPI003561B512
MNTINTPMYNGYLVQSEKGELIENILIRNEQVVNQALHHHKRLIALRFELKFPAMYQGDCEIISKFFDSLRVKLKFDLASKSKKRNRRIHSELNYVWVKEQSRSMGWHYHVVIFLNHDVYNCFGRVASIDENLYSRLFSAWTSALGVPESAAKGLVHISKPTHKLDLDSDTTIPDIFALLSRISYFAKVATKPYGTGERHRFFGTSSIKNKEPVLNSY